MTGTSYLVNEVAGKLVELLKDGVPAATSVAVFVNPSNLGAAPLTTAKTLGLTIPQSLLIRADQVIQ